MTRGYESALRAAQAQATRQRILDALLEQASEAGRDDFSIAEIAARAGVAERTVFRYFPTRESLFDAVAEVVDQHSRTGLEPKSFDDIVGAIMALFAWFEEHPELVEASHAPGIGLALRARGRKLRAERIRKMTDAWLSELSEPERRRAFAVFRTMFGSATWHTMRKELGLSAKDTATAVQWVLELVCADLKRQKRDARKKGRK